MIDMLTRINLQEPLWLALLVVPWLLHAGRTAMHRRAGDRLQRFADAHLLQRLLRGNAAGARHWRRAFIAAWLLATLAASGPYLAATPAGVDEQRGVDIMVIVDISPSMRVADTAPNRLARAALELTDFVARLQADRIGLIAFSANAYRLLPLTHDYRIFRDYLAYLDTSLVFRQGSNLALALEQAETSLQRDAQPARAVILLSDGESHYPGAAAVARRLGAAGTPLLVMGLGTDAGGPVPAPQGGYVDADGEPVVSHLQREALREIATASGGLYTDARDDDSDWDLVFARLNAIDHTNRYRYAAADEGLALFPWLLAGALALFIVAGARRPEGFAIVLLWPLLGAAPDAQAWVWQEQQAWDALSAGDCAEAGARYRQIDTYDGWFGAGAAAWRCEQWNDALQAFIKAGEHAATDEQRARAAYNRGNSLARLGRIDEAGRAFEEALTYQPNYQRAARNLTLLRERQNVVKLGGETAGKYAPPRADRRAADVDARLTSQTLGDLRNMHRSLPPGPDRTPGNRQDTAVLPPLIDAWQLSPDRDSATLGSALQQLEQLEENKLEFLRQRIITGETRLGRQLEDKPW